MLIEGARVAPHLVLDRRLGVGGQGEVWRTRDENRGAWVALKILRPQAHWRQLARFEQEARLLSMLDHRGLVRLHDFDLSSERPWLALELVEGETLREVIVAHLARRVVVRLGWAASVIDQVCEALEYAHARGVVHRDLKPSNVIVGSSTPPVAKLIDLGIAKWMGQSRNQATTIAQGFVGSMGYMAPEQLTGGTISERTDVHQLGVLLFTLLAARVPWVGPGEPIDQLRAPVMVERIVSARRPRLVPLRPDVSDTLDVVLMRAMAIAPKDRFASMTALRIALRDAFDPLIHEAQEAVATTPEQPLSSLLDSDEMAAFLGHRTGSDLRESDDPTRRLDEDALATAHAMATRGSDRAETPVIAQASTVLEAPLLPRPLDRLPVSDVTPRAPSPAHASLAADARETVGTLPVASRSLATLRGISAASVDPAAEDATIRGDARVLPSDPAPQPVVAEPSSSVAPVPDRRADTAALPSRAARLDGARLAWPIALTVWGLVALVYVWRLPERTAIPRVAAPVVTPHDAPAGAEPAGAEPADHAPAALDRAGPAPTKTATRA